MSADRKLRTEHLNARNIALSDAAIDWIVHLGSGTATPRDRREFEAWRARSPAHAAAAEEATALLDSAGHTRASQHYREIGDALRIRPSRVNRRQILSGGIAASLAAGLVGSGVFGPVSRLFADYGTGVGERRTVRLPDGSVVWLNTSSAVSVEFSGRDRKLTLHAGEALFDVARHAARPFIVRSGNGEARALDTIYSVRRQGDRSDVVVSKGQVEVRSGSERALIEAGQQLAFGDGLLGAVRVADSAASTAWTRGKLIFNNRALAEVAAEMERYHHGRIILVGNRLRDLRVTGVFSLDDPDQLVRSIASHVGAEVLRMPLVSVLR